MLTQQWHRMHNKRESPSSIDAMLGLRLRRRPSIAPMLGRCVCFGWVGLHDPDRQSVNVFCRLPTPYTSLLTDETIHVLILSYFLVLLFYLRLAYKHAFVSENHMVPLRYIYVTTVDRYTLSIPRSRYIVNPNYHDQLSLYTPDSFTRMIIHTFS